MSCAIGDAKYPAPITPESPGKARSHTCRHKTWNNANLWLFAARAEMSLTNDAAAWAIRALVLKHVIYE